MILGHQGSAGFDFSIGILSHQDNFSSFVYYGKIEIFSGTQVGFMNQDSRVQIEKTRSLFRFAGPDGSC